MHIYYIFILQLFYLCILYLFLYLMKHHPITTVNATEEYRYSSLDFSV